MGACASRCSHQFKDLQLSDTSCAMGDASKKSDFATATPASEATHATSSTPSFLAMEQQIEQLKSHWSTLVDHFGDMDKEEVDFEVSNEQEFQALQRLSIWGSFFANFNGDGKSTGFGYIHGELVVGNKFAEGGQAQLYEAHIKWIDPRIAKRNQKTNGEYVLKVFKEGTLLKHVKSQLPQGLLQSHAKSVENLMSPTPKKSHWYNSKVHRGILLKGGRFAFLMEKYHCDLCTLIECNMKLKSDEECGPFSKEEVESFMYGVVLGVDWLHNCDNVHRDLKASNVIVYEHGRGWSNSECYAADFECSIRVVGTNFFRSPEILQACKDRKVKEWPEVFSRASDVYSYRITCYEMLTRKLPFEDHPLRGSPLLLIDLVINQHLYPEVPKYVEDWTRELLAAC